VVVGALTGPCNYTAEAGYDAFSHGTTACNIGGQPLIWLANNNQHPVIGGTLYRYDPSNNGRFTMVGMSWLKHGFGALQQTLCGPCNAYPNTTALGVGCSDPYGACQNGTQAPLGPRSEINATTGAFPYPPSDPAWSGNTERRLRVPLALLDTNSTYVSEAQYVQYQDALGGVDDNNASYRISTVSGTPADYSLAYSGPTVQGEPAINAWAALDPGVVLQTVQVPGTMGGLFSVGIKRIDNGDGTWRFECCAHNLNCHDSASSFTVSFAGGVTITNQGFHAPEWHANEVYDNNAWIGSAAANGATWMVDQPFAANPNSNALRWGSAYSFWFDANDPDPTGIALDLYRSGGSATIPAPVFPPESWETNGVDASLDVNGNTANDPFVGPIITNLASGALHTANIGGTAGQGFELYLTSSAAVPSYYTSADGDIVNLDLMDPSLFGLFGYQPLPAGGLSFQFNEPGTLFYAGQVISMNPATVEGFSLSAATELSLMPLPRALVESVGTNSYTANTNGFWRITHHGTTAANITSVVLSYQGATGPANGVYFDTDQGMPSGSGNFSQGNTYEQNSDVACGLDYSVSSPFSGSGWIGSDQLNGANYNTVEFRFTGGLFNNRTFRFNADTDPGTQGAADNAGMSVTVTFSNGDVVTGVLAQDPANSNRTLVELQ